MFIKELINLIGILEHVLNGSADFWMLYHNISLDYIFYLFVHFSKTPLHETRRGFQVGNFRRQFDFVHLNH